MIFTSPPPSSHAEIADLKATSKVSWFDCSKRGKINSRQQNTSKQKLTGESRTQASFTKTLHSLKPHRNFNPNSDNTASSQQHSGSFLIMPLLVFAGQPQTHRKYSPASKRFHLSKSVCSKNCWCRLPENEGSCYFICLGLTINSGKSFLPFQLSPDHQYVVNSYHWTLQREVKMPAGSQQTEWINRAQQEARHPAVLQHPFPERRWGTTLCFSVFPPCYYLSTAEDRISA